jgi:hypothetical protein
VDRARAAHPKVVTPDTAVIAVPTEKVNKSTRTKSNEGFLKPGPV